MSIKDDFERLFAGDMPQEEGVEFLCALYEKGESSDDIYDAMQVMRSHSVPFDVDEEIRPKLIDNCGTGGDKSGAFNISTTASFVLAGADEFVAKHGNRSITSRSGSADLLEALGFRLDMEAQKQRVMLSESGFVFLFAQNHHPAMKHIMPIRKSLSHRTIFNILGPLANPAGVKRHLIGVFDHTLAAKMAKALQTSGSKCGIVLSSRSGMDEAALHEPTVIVRFDENGIEESVVDPVDLGFSAAPLQAVLGADAIENAKITMEILENRETGAKRDIVLLNAALALYGAGSARDMQDGVEMAKESLLSLKALDSMKKALELSRKL